MKRRLLLLILLVTLAGLSFGCASGGGYPMGYLILGEDPGACSFRNSYSIYPDINPPLAAARMEIVRVERQRSPRELNPYGSFGSFENSSGGYSESVGSAHVDRAPVAPPAPPPAPQVVEPRS
jgi:hypothetical protein